MRTRIAITAAMLAGGVLVSSQATSVATAQPVQPARAKSAAVPSVPDPGRPGPYRTVTGEYELSPVTLPDLDEAVEFGAVVVAPPDAPGPLPVVLFMPGHFPTCFKSPTEEDTMFGWPCNEGYQPTRSAHGFLPAQKLLASQGFLTLSIKVNGVNNQDGFAIDGAARARSSLVRQHLVRLADWAAGGDGEPDILRTVPRPDLSRVVLVGHSRGGDGVSRAAMDSLYPPPAEENPEPDATRWRIRGLALLAPTSFGHNPVPDVPSMSLLPNCDGDVTRLEGQAYVDGSRGVSKGTALHSAVYLTGANHNYFNTEWSPEQTTGAGWDDFKDNPDAVCTPGTAPGRLTETEQRTVGDTYIAAAARLFGTGEDAVRPLLDGSGAQAPSIGRAVVRTHAIGGLRTPLVVPDPSVTATGAQLCTLADQDPQTSCGLVGSPHAAQVWGMEADPGAYGAVLKWTTPGEPARFRPDKPVSLTDAEAAALRIIVPANSTGTRLEVAVSDQAGKQAVLGEVRLDGIPGTSRTYAAWAQEARVPLSPASAVDLAHIAELTITPRSTSGQAWLVDAWGWKPGTSQAEPAAAARVDLGEATVDEREDGTAVVTVSATVTGSVSGQVWLAIRDAEAHQRSRLTSVQPGVHTLELPLAMTGDRKQHPKRTYRVQAWPASNSVVGAYRSEVIIRDDD